MKYYIRLIVVFGAMMVSVSSCMNDLFDSDELAGNNMTEGEAYLDPTKAELLLTRLYSMVGEISPILYNGSISALCDEAIDYSGVPFNVGAWGPNGIPGLGNLWNKSYEAIRTANKFMEQIGDMPVNAQQGFTEERKAMMVIETKCLRAFFYTNLIRFYGGVPLITESAKNTDKETIASKPRETLAKTVEWTIGELDAVTKELPLNWTGKNFGKVTKGMAMATKSRLLLYVASPLFNSKGADKTGNLLVCFGEEKNERWENALDAATAVIKLNLYSLHTTSTVAATRSVYCDVLFADRNINVKERIFSFQKARSNKWNISYLPLPMRTDATWPTIFPSYNAHIAYETTAGEKAILRLKDNGDGTYSENIQADSKYDPSKPHLNRDPRYYDAIMFNQAKYRNFTCNIYTPYPGDEEVGFGKEYETYGVKSGFYMRKFVNPNINVSGANGTGFEDFPIFRYAEILLNYAEAMNVLYGADDKPAEYPYSAREAINEIRKRLKSSVVGAESYRPVLANGMPLIPLGLDRSDMEQRIREERRVELMFEGHRFFDVRRWMIAPKTEREVMYYDIRKKKDGTFEYYIRKYHNRVFTEPQMYLLPIPFGEVQINPECKQNPGW